MVGGWPGGREVGGERYKIIKREMGECAAVAGVRGGGIGVRGGTE